MALWNPWHGCHKISAGCLHCYVYRTDAKFEKDSSQVTKTKQFDLPIRRNRAGEYKLVTDIVYTCFTSDFFVEDADAWRSEAWRMMRERTDLNFLIITKRIHRFHVSLPEDWGGGYDHVSICCTAENQTMADERLPIFLREPIRHRSIICEPLLGPIDLTRYLNPTIEQVVVGGESGQQARVCDYEWVLDLRRQCVEARVPFHFKQTGANFKKGGHLYRIERKFQHAQARRAAIDYQP